MKVSEFLQNWDSFNTPFAFVIGERTDYSLSPIMHKTAAKFHGISFDYFGLDVAKDEFGNLKKILSHPNCKGANCTIPYKKDIIELLDAVDDKVTSLEACNTIIHQYGKLKGFNTDVDGFIKPLLELIDNSNEYQAFIFGSGGAARAASFGLTSLHITNKMISRNPIDGQLSYENWQDSIQSQKKIILINSTPLGMIGKENESPISLNQLKAIKPEISYDLIYNPAETKFLSLCKKAGVKHQITGLPMLIGQGDLAFEKWTKLKFPQTLIQTKCEEVLKGKS